MNIPLYVVNVKITEEDKMGLEDWELTPKDTPEKKQDDTDKKDKKDDLETDQKETQKKAGGYDGPERRKGQRRKGHDRRNKIRFEQKVDRRSGKERRGVEGLWKLRDF